MKQSEEAKEEITWCLPVPCFFTDTTLITMDPAEILYGGFMDQYAVMQSK